MKNRFICAEEVAQELSVSNGEIECKKIVEQKTFVINKAWRFSILTLFNYALYYDHYIEFFRLI